MRQVRADGYQEFAAARARHLYRSACLLTGGDAQGRVRRAENPAGYAQTVLTRTFLAHQRRRSSRERATDVIPDAPAAPGSDSSLRLTLIEALAQLPPKDRAVVVLRYWEDPGPSRRPRLR